MTLVVDWWQLGWLFAGLFFLLMVATMILSRGLVKKGQDQGWHDRQHWETDQVVKGKLERQ